MLIIGVLLLLVVCVAIKVADNKIRKSASAKAAINIAAIAGAIFTLIGFVQSLIELFSVLKN